MGNRKLFVISDVHGFYDEMIASLNAAGFDPSNENHWLISCGDAMDRGPKAYEVLQYLNSLPRKVLIRGNHEDLLEQVLVSHKFEKNDISNGTMNTVQQLSIAYWDIEGGLAYDEFGAAIHNAELGKYIDSLVDYCEVDKYVFVHGWIPLESVSGTPLVTINDIRYNDKRVPAKWQEGDWYIARWFCGPMEGAKGNYLPDKCIVCGHWHCNFAHWMANVNRGKDEWQEPNYEPFYDGHYICIDACTVKSHKVNCIVLEA